MAKKPILEIPSFIKKDLQGMRESKRPGPYRPSFMIKKGRPSNTPSFLKKSDAKGYTNPPRKADTSTV